MGVKWNGDSAISVRNSRRHVDDNAATAIEDGYDEIL
jgi:hypothetical protein